MTELTDKEVEINKKANDLHEYAKKLDRDVLAFLFANIFSSLGCLDAKLYYGVFVHLSEMLNFKGRFTGINSFQSLMNVYSDALNSYREEFCNDID